MRRSVLAVSGLMAEARIAAGVGVATVSGGGDAARLASWIETALAEGVGGVVSFGIAGGLRPGLRPGTCVIGRAVDDGRTRWIADPAWTRHLASSLPHAVVADLAGVDRAVLGVDGKAALHISTGAAAVDMESHIAARLAALHGVPFAALRIIADPAERMVPLAAMVGMRPDGSTDVGAVLGALGRNPGELAALLRTAFDARAAFLALRRDRRRISARFGFDHREVEPAPDGSPALPAAPISKVRQA